MTFINQERVLIIKFYLEEMVFNTFKPIKYLIRIFDKKKSYYSCDSSTKLFFTQRSNTELISFLT